MALTDPLTETPVREPITPTGMQVSRVWWLWFVSVFTKINETWRVSTDYSGRAILSSGTVVIPNTNILSTMNVILSGMNNSVNAGFLSYTTVDNTSITVLSTNASDDRTIYYEIREAE